MAALSVLVVLLVVVGWQPFQVAHSAHGVPKSRFVLAEHIPIPDPPVQNKKIVGFTTSFADERELVWSRAFTGLNIFNGTVKHVHFGKIGVFAEGIHNLKDVAFLADLGERPSEVVADIFSKYARALALRSTSLQNTRSWLQFNLYNHPCSFCIYESLSIGGRSLRALSLKRDAVSNRLYGSASLKGLPPNKSSREDANNYEPECVPDEPLLYIGILCAVLFSLLAILSGQRIVDSDGHNRSAFVGVVIGFLGLLCNGSYIVLGSPTAIFGLRWLLYGEDEYCHYKESQLHGEKVYHKKFLTDYTFCNTVNRMANILSAEKQTAIIAALAEGSSIRSIERITGVHRDTIVRLGVRVGKGCEMLLDSKMQDLGCNYLQLDEVWGFIGKKERHCRIDDNPEYGDVWTFCAIDSETKLVPAFKCGKRNAETANAFVLDIANRVRNRVQISTDALGAYGEAVERAFGADVDYSQIVKVYTHDAAQHPERKYSAPTFASAYRRPIAGNPEMELVSTSYVERLNATTRLHVKRLSRLTLAFSKKFENFQAAVALHFAYYNFVRRHNTLRCTPAMAAGVERDFWSVADLIEATA